MVLPDGGTSTEPRQLELVRWDEGQPEIDPAAVSRQALILAERAVTETPTEELSADRQAALQGMMAQAGTGIPALIENQTEVLLDTGYRQTGIAGKAALPRMARSRRPDGTVTGPYAITTGVPSADIPAPPSVPDGDRYNTTGVRRRMPEIAPGPVRIIPLPETEFIDPRMDPVIVRGPDDRKPIISIRSGIHTQETLLRALNDTGLLERDGDAVHARAPIVVGRQATLIVANTTLRLEKQGGSVLANGGDLFIVNATVTSWNASAGRPAAGRISEERVRPDTFFRPHIVAWSNSTTRIAGSTISHLGSRFSESYGITLSTGPEGRDLPPSGSIVGSTVRNNHYGLLTWDAADITVAHNRFIRNIQYGIDPHDFTTDLLISNNTVRGTQLRHGIIISRGVRRAAIVGNEVSNSTLTGIMLDRSSTGNLVANNTVYGNGRDGIAVKESPGNLLYHNIVRNNGEDGVVVQNSWDIGIYGTMAQGNDRNGINVQSIIGSNPSRDVVQDPYRAFSSIEIGDTTFQSNGESSIRFENVAQARVWGLTSASDTIRFGGDLDDVPDTRLRPATGTGPGVTITAPLADQLAHQAGQMAYSTLWIAEQRLRTIYDGSGNASAAIEALPDRHTVADDVRELVIDQVTAGVG